MAHPSLALLRQLRSLHLPDASLRLLPELRHYGCPAPDAPSPYPTTLRNTGTSWCQAFARFGGSAPPSFWVLPLAGHVQHDVNGTMSNNWSMVVLVLLIPFVLGLLCTPALREEHGRKDYGRAAKSSPRRTRCPRRTAMAAHDRRCCHQLHRLHRVPAGHPRLLKTAMALPIMLIAMLLPFIYFFVFGGLGLGKGEGCKGRGCQHPLSFALVVNSANTEDPRYCRGLPCLLTMFARLLDGPFCRGGRSSRLALICSCAFPGRVRNPSSSASSPCGRWDGLRV